MKKEVKFSLVFRDMWQSAGKYQPRVDQLVKVAPAIIRMGCFDRVETNGGGFEQVNLLYGENPNKSVREWTKPFHEAGIQTSVHYPAAHKFSTYKELGAVLPQTDYVTDNEITLPMYAALTEEQVNFICDTFEKAVKEIK